MPRYRRRDGSRRGSVLPLIVMLVIALILIILLSNGRSLTLALPRIELPNVPNITIPITGLPQIELPTVRIPVTLVPGTLLPEIGIGGTPVPPNTGGNTNALGQRTKSSDCEEHNGLPDGACTPGSVTNATVSQVCQVGYASSVRDVPQAVKDQVYAEYGVVSHSAGQYEVDHLVPLELGGSNSIANLWPQPASPTPGFHQKDQVENYLHDQVCSGKISLGDAQREIATNWLAVFNQMSH